LANIDVIEREGLCEHVQANERAFRAMLESLRDLPIVGDVRGAGYFQAIELVKDPETKQTFDDAESEELLRGFLSGELYRRGLICRTGARACRRSSSRGWPITTSWGWASARASRTRRSRRRCSRPRASAPSRCSRSPTSCPSSPSPSASLRSW